MKKLILPAFLAAGLVGFAGNASAHGLYVSLGYNIGSPKLESTKGTCYSGNQYCYPGFDEYLPGVWDKGGPATAIKSDGTFGNGGWPSVNYDGFGYWFDLGGVETWNFKPSGTLSFSAAVGWSFPLSPLRMELEYSRTSFKVKKFNLDIFSPGSVTLDDSMFWAALDEGGDIGSDYAFKDSFDIEFDDSEQLNVTTSTMMLNTFFRIPLNAVEGLTPYVGFGIGTFSMNVSGGWVQPDWAVNYSSPGQGGPVGWCENGNCVGEGPWDPTYGKLQYESDVGAAGYPANMITGISNRLAYQLMAGLEYRFPKTPYIVGLEYRFLKVDNAPDKDNNNGNRLYIDRVYVWDNWYNTYQQSQIALKFRYDFISDEY